MELMEWLALKYEAYLSRVQLLKHEQIHISKYTKEDAQMSGLQVLVSDQQVVIDSLKEKISQLQEVEGILERIQRRTGDKRSVIERDVEEIQMDLGKLQINKLVSDIKRTS